MAGSTTATDELVRTCGQLLVVGFEGTCVPPDVLAALERGERGGVILFRRNLPSVEQAARSCRDILAAVPEGHPAPIVSLDQEGGRVRRLPSPPFVELPPMRRLASTDDERITRRAAEVNGLQLRSLGFNLNFAPVVDVDTNPDNPVIGDRAFSSEPLAVVKHAAAFIEGQRAAGIASCLKHFLGHGDTDLDSHTHLPVVRHPRTRLDAVELVPFVQLASSTDAMMSAHVIFEAVDPNTVATRSRAVCTGLLREQMGFQGVLFSDDMEMRAVADLAGVEDNAVTAVDAGCDLLLMCHSAELQSRAHEALVRRAEASSDFRRRCRQACARALHMRSRLPRHATEFDADAMLRQSQAFERDLDVALRTR